MFPLCLHASSCVTGVISPFGSFCKQPKKKRKKKARHINYSSITALRNKPRQPPVWSKEYFWRTTRVKKSPTWRQGQGEGQEEQSRSSSKNNSIQNKERQWWGKGWPHMFCCCVSLSWAAPTLLLPQGNSVFSAAVSLKPHSRLNMTCQWYSKTFSNLVLLQSRLSVDLEEWVFDVILNNL